MINSSYGVIFRMHAVEKLPMFFVYVGGKCLLVKSVKFTNMREEEFAKLVRGRNTKKNV